MISISHLAVLSLAALTASDAPTGEKLPKGPPWHVTYQAARSEALREGRPIFVYFTKTV